MGETNDISDDTTIIEWVLKKHTVLQGKNMSSFHPTIDQYPHINPKIENTSFLPFSSFKKYLTGFSSKRVGVTSVSMIVAVKEAFNLTVFVGSHLDPAGCYLGRKFILQIPPGHAILFHQNLVHAGSKGTTNHRNHCFFLWYN